MECKIIQVFEDIGILAGKRFFLVGATVAEIKTRDSIRFSDATITPPDKFVLRVQNCEFILGRPLRTLNFLFGLIFFYISILSMAMPIL